MSKYCVTVQVEVRLAIMVDGSGHLDARAVVEEYLAARPRMLALIRPIAVGAEALGADITSEGELSARVMSAYESTAYDHPVIAMNLPVEYEPGKKAT